MKSILVVDDQAICREPIAEALRKHGYRVCCAADGGAALAACRRQTPDLILLDLVMPGGDGLSVLGALRGNPAWRNVPVILLTDVADRESVLRAGQLGAAGYLLKSHFSLSETLNRIRDLLTQGHGPITPAQAEASAITPERSTGDAEPTGGPGPTTHVQAGRLTGAETVRRLEELGQLKTLAGSVAEVIAAASSPFADRAHLAAALNRDPVLATRVLRLANSAAHAASRTRIPDIEQAIGVIGFDAVRNVAASVGVFDAFPAGTADDPGAVRCWQHCLAVATLMDRITPKSEALARGVPHLVGLCHDLGEIVLRQYFAAEYSAAVELAAETQRPMQEVEAEAFGLSRAELTRLVLGKLGLPRDITEPIGEFFQAAGRTGWNRTPLAVALRIADFYAHGLLFASTSDAPIAPVPRADLASAGVAKPSRIDAVSFRSEIETMSHLLAGLSPADEAKLREPLFPRRGVRIWYARHESLAEFDPLATALQLLADAEVQPALPVDAAALSGFSGMVIAAPREDTPAFTAAEAGRCRTGKEPAHVPTLFLSGQDDPRHRSPARSSHTDGASGEGLEVCRFPITLRTLASFIAAL